MLRLPADHRALATNLDLPSAYCGALQSTLFFLNPFGLTLLDLPSTGWLISLLGVVVAIGAGAVNPCLVATTAGAILSLNTILVDAGAGEAFHGRSFDGLTSLIACAVGFAAVFTIGARAMQRA